MGLVQPSRAGPSRAAPGPDRTGPSRARPGQARPRGVLLTPRQNLVFVSICQRTGPPRDGVSTARPGWAKPGRAGLGRAGPGRARPGSGRGPGRAGPAQPRVQSLRQFCTAIWPRCKFSNYFIQPSWPTFVLSVFLCVQVSGQICHWAKANYFFHW